MLIIGLTGSIAMGKSATSKTFNSYGVPVFNADKCVHKLLGPNGKLVSIIGKRFVGTLVKTTNIKYIDRVKLGSIIFNDEKKKIELESIVHPQVGIERKKWKEWAQRQRFKAICYDVPLLFETQGEKFCDVYSCCFCTFFYSKTESIEQK